MSSADDTCQKLLTENADLRTRLEEAQDTLRAIREGEVDALVVYGLEGERIYTLKGADHSYRILVETISEGTVTLSPDGDILYANQQMAAMLGRRLEQIIGSTIFSFIPPNELGNFRTLLAHAKKGASRGEIFLKKGDGSLVPTLLSCRSLRLEEVPEAVCLVAMDLTGLKETETALQESEQKLRLLTSQLLNAQESERKRIASELHDGLGHAMLTIKLQLRLLEKQLAPEQLSLGEEMESMVEYLDKVINDMHRLYNALTPGDLESLGLTTALSSMVDEFMGLHDTIGWSVHLDNIDDLYPPPAQTVIYRIIQEILTNIGKHANASRVSVIIKRENQGASFTVEDDGQGFNMEKVLATTAAKRGLGLLAMEERVRILGGSLTIWSRENQGTRITFTIPVSKGGI